MEIRLTVHLECSGTPFLPLSWPLSYLLIFHSGSIQERHGRINIPIFFSPAGINANLSMHPFEGKQHHVLQDVAVWVEFCYYAKPPRSTCHTATSTEPWVPPHQSWRRDWCHLHPTGHSLYPTVAYALSQWVVSIALMADTTPDFEQTINCSAIIGYDNLACEVFQYNFSLLYWKDNFHLKCTHMSTICSSLRKAQTLCHQNIKDNFTFSKYDFSTTSPSLGKPDLQSLDMWIISEYFFH